MELRVNTGELAAQGAGLQDGATNIPEPLAPFASTGTDALSSILNTLTQQKEAPLIEGMPQTKADAQATAQNIVKAASMYEQSDQQIADNVRKALAALDGTAGGSENSPNAGAPGGAAQQSGGQLQQMMGMPMQMAQQAAQVPMQMAQMAGQLPQGIMQGVQSGVQQVSQMAGQPGQNEDSQRGGREQQPENADHPQDESRSDEQAQPSDVGAAGPGNGERAPEPAPVPELAPDTSQSEGLVPHAAPPQSAPSRPPKSDPSIVL